MSKFGELSASNVLGLGAVMGVNDAIELQEKLGQRDLCQSSAIPVSRDRIADDQLKALGFVLGERVVGDKLFQQATLPPGWKMVITDHAMWSKIVDGKGRERFAVFFKAASYDRKAHMNSIRRYNLDSDYDTMEKTKRSRVVVRDYDGKVLFSLDGTVQRALRGEDSRETIDAYYKESESLRKQAEAWMDANYPQHADFTAYWD